MLLPFIARTDTERRVVINTIGPVWEGNQVWLILGGGAIFAAWPALYAASFSGFYLAMLLVLAALILRPVGFKFRSKMPGARWRKLGLGAVRRRRGARAGLWRRHGKSARGGSVQLRFRASRNLYVRLVRPAESLRTAVRGLVSIAMLMTHGAVYLAIKTDGVLARRARTISRLAAVAWVLLFALAGIWMWRGPFGYADHRRGVAGWQARSAGKGRDVPKRGVALQLPPLARHHAGPRSGSGGSLDGGGFGGIPSPPCGVYR